MLYLNIDYKPVLTTGIFTFSTVNFLTNTAYNDKIRLHN